MKRGRFIENYLVEVKPLLGQGGGPERHSDSAQAVLPAEAVLPPASAALVRQRRLFACSMCITCSCFFTAADLLAGEQASR